MAKGDKQKTSVDDPADPAGTTAMSTALGNIFERYQRNDPDGVSAMIARDGGDGDGLYDRSATSYNENYNDPSYLREIMSEIGVSSDVQLNRQIAKALENPQQYLNEKTLDLERRGRIILRQFEQNKSDFKLSGLSSEQAKSKAIKIAKEDYSRMNKLNDKVYPVEATQAAREKLARQK